MQKMKDRIKLLREEHHLSQEQLAEKMGISSNSYGKLERGETKLTLEKLEQIANIFDMDIVELINNEDRISYSVTHYGSGTNAFNVEYSERELLAENEKLSLIITHKDELLKQQQQEITLLKEMLAMLKASALVQSE